ncbi:MAG: mechanosensitive ion channel [Desulfovibrio sp.]|nr:mechanosensitive ion channel [Desulfovibrio sp.]
MLLPILSGARPGEAAAEASRPPAEGRISPPGLRFALVLLALALWLCPTACWAAASPAPEKPVAAKPDKPDAGSEAKTEAKSDKTETKQEQVDPWENVWTGQREMLKDVNVRAAALRDGLNAVTADLNKKIRPYEEEARRLLVLTNNFKNWPNPLEAVSRRISAIVREVRQNMDPLAQSRAEAQNLLGRVSQQADSLPEDVRGGKGNTEVQAYIKAIAQAKTQLAAVLALYDRALEPSVALLDRLRKTQEEISSHLPVLWKNYYLLEPAPWLSLAQWRQVPQAMRYAVQGMSLRLPVELPATDDQRTTALLRFVLGLGIASLLCFLLARRLLNPESPAPARRIFRVSCPFLCLGAALLGSSLSVNGEFYRLLLALGNLSVIAGQICLAWDLRRLKYPEAGGDSAPFWRLMPLTFCAYALLYLPLVRLVTLVFWGLCVIAALLWLRSKSGKRAPACALSLENGILDSEGIVLWLCLLLCTFGLHTYSMILYLLFVSSSLALELGLGSMALVSDISGKLPSEGAKAAMGHLLLAFAAPVVLVTAVSSVLLWLATLPGGLYLLREYLFQGVNVGETQFDVIHLLLLITVFYLARTAVAMGTRLLAKLPRQGLTIDATLIPPMQTAYTYAVWCVFGLFALRSLGMELSNLAVVAGGLSVGIGFGMQNIVNNFISGLILIFSRMLQAGDVVEVGGVTGRVRKISVRATMVETYDNALIYVPNSEFVSSRLINWTRNSRSVRREIRVGVAYGSNTENVMKIMLDIAREHHNVLKYPAPSAAFVDFGDSTLDFQLRFWVKDYDVGVSTSSDIRLEMERQFRAHGIDVAFPQMDVHIKEMPQRLKASLPAAQRHSPRGLGKRPPARGRKQVGGKQSQHKNQQPKGENER